MNMAKTTIWGAVSDLGWKRFEVVQGYYKKRVKRSKAFQIGWKSV
jgi:hypothetical protein